MFGRERGGGGGGKAQDDATAQTTVGKSAATERGDAIDPAMLRPVEQVTGVALGEARVHDGPGANELAAGHGARAFAHGNDVFLGAGESRHDPALMAHELAHVAQQRGGSPVVQAKGGAGPAEQEADAVADQVVTEKPAGLIVDPWRSADGGQLSKIEFLSRLRGSLVEAVEQEMGGDANAAACPYITAWFSRHILKSALEVEKIAQRFSGVSAPTSAEQYFPPIVQRVRAGVRKWQQGGSAAIASELSSAGLDASAAGVAVSGTSTSVQKKALASPDAMSEHLGAGAPLDSATASRMGDAFGRDFGDVRVHTNSAAAETASAVGASAFAVGNDVAFGSGAYAPGTAHGDALLAHELAHVAQQRDAGGDGAARRRAIGDESAAAESDANTATKAAMTRIADPTKSAPRADIAMATGFQLQRCPSNADKIATADVKGQWEGKTVAKQNMTTTINVDLEVTAVRTLATPQQTEAAAIALVQTNGKAGAVTIENGLYIAYETTGFNNKGTQMPKSSGSTVVISQAPVCMPGVVAVRSNDGLVYRPDKFDPNAKASQPTTSDRHMNGIDDPFQGYKDAFGDGKSMDAASNPDLLAAFGPALRDTAFAVLAQSEREVQQKKPKFDKGTAGVPDPERALIRSTADRLLPVQKDLDEAERNKDAFLVSLTKTGEVGAKGYEKWSKEVKRLLPIRNAIRKDYPMLARLSTKELESFSKQTDEQQIATLGGEMPGILKDIEKTRANIAAGKLNLWESKEIVEATIVGLGINQKEKRDLILERQKEESKKGTLETIVKVVLSIGLGVGATLIGGPIGLAMAAGALGMDLYDAAHETDEYFTKKAASNTNIDPNRSILNPDQVGHWGWLVVAWAAVGLDVLDVKAAVKALDAGKPVSKVADELAKTHAGLKGMTEGELAQKLKTAAGELKAGEILTETNKAGVVNRLGVAIEIDKSIAESEVRIGWRLEKSTGRVEVTGMRVGAKAAIEDILAHQHVLQLMRRYEGLTGKVRSLWDRLRSLGGKVPDGVNPFPPGSAAWESWFEVEKLPRLIEARTTKYGPHLSKEAEAILRQDVDFLQTELAHHQKIVDQLVLEAGQGFVAKAGDSTMKAVNDMGYSLPGVTKKPPLTAVDVEAANYYYRLDNGKPVLVKKANRPGDSLRAEIGPNGQPTGKFLAGEPTRAEKAKQIVNAMPPDKQTAFQELVDKMAKLEPDAKVVPVDGLAATKRSLAQVTQEFGNATFKADLISLLTKALVQKGVKGPEAAAIAKKAADALMSHEIMVVRGTDQLRAYGYRARFASKTGAEVEDDLHHIVPLYLGGDHQVKNLIDMDPVLHDKLHELVETVKFNDKGVTLAPASIQNAADLTFTHGAAVLHKDGTITFDTLVKK